MLTMFDSIDVSQLPAGSGYAYAGYVDGHWPTYSAVKAKFPNAHVLSITVFGNNASCADVEAGDMTNASVYDWFKRQVANKVFRPVVYTSVSNMNPMVATMTANGFARSSYRLWSAHYGAGMHICGPATCRLTSTACDGTQWTDNALGRNLDQSVLNDNFFGVTWVWKEWVTAGELSLTEFAAAANLGTSTFLRIQVEKFGAFNELLSAYINAGDLTAKMPKGMTLWTRVRTG